MHEACINDVGIQGEAKLADVQHNPDVPVRGCHNFLPCDSTRKLIQRWKRVQSVPYLVLIFCLALMMSLCGWTLRLLG